MTTTIQRANGTQHHAPSATPPQQARAEKLAALRQRRDDLQAKIEEVPLADRIAAGGDRTLYIERNKLNAEIEALETMGDGGPRLAVELDDYGSALVRRCADGNVNTIPADVVNGALGFMLGEDDDHHVEQEITSATRRRLQDAKTAAGMPGSPVSVTLTFTPAAWGLLTAMAAYDEDASVKACIMRNLSTDVESFVEGVHSFDHVTKLFLDGEVNVAKEAA